MGFAAKLLGLCIGWLLIWIGADVGMFNWRWAAVMAGGIMLRLVPEI